VIPDSYHLLLDINYMFESPRKIDKPRTFQDFNNIDYEAINEFLSNTDW